MSIDEAKRLAGIAACNEVQSGMKVGLGTGSTVHHTIVELARRHHEEDLEIVGVPTSLATHALATELGLPLVELDDVEGLDLVIDGADEVDAAFQLIKGGGAALLREKLVAQASRAMVVVADDRKMVETLGAFPLPIEITRFGHGTTVRAIMDVLGCTAQLRMDGEAPLVGQREFHRRRPHGPTPHGSGGQRGSAAPLGRRRAGRPVHRHVRCGSSCRSLWR